jgi:hypothetical protein
VADVFVATAIVVTVKVAEVAPAAIVTDDGGVAALELLLRAIARPPVGAAELMVAVPVDDVPPTIEVGFSMIELRVGALIVSVAV